MDVALVLARLILAAVFAAAGAAKLADLAGSRAALAGFGIPERAARVLGTLLPFAELAVAGLLLFSSTARAGAVAALALLALFAAGIAISMARGRAPDCHCFGQLHSEPAGARTLARNVVLAAIATFAVFAGDSAGPGVSEAVAELDGAEWLAVAGALVFVVVMAGVVAAMVGLLRQNGRLLLRVEGLEEALRAEGVSIPQRGVAEGLPVGTSAPGFSLPGLHGETVTLESLRATGKPIVLFFTDPDCSSCRQLMPRVGEWQRSRASDLAMAIVSHGISGETSAEAAEHGLQNVLVDEDDDVAEDYRARFTPSAVVIDDEGRIATPVASGDEAIESLVGQAAAPALEVVPSGPPRLAEGDELPETAMMSLEGVELTLADVVAGRERTVLLWDPGCGFCQRMLGDLRALESGHPEVTGELLVVSQGTAEANRKQGIASEVVIEQTAFGLGRAVGAPGTPSAVRVDGAGRVVSPVAVGAEAVMGLLRHAAKSA